MAFCITSARQHHRKIHDICFTIAETRYGEIINPGENTHPCPKSNLECQHFSSVNQFVGVINYFTCRQRLALSVEWAHSQRSLSLQLRLLRLQMEVGTACTGWAKLNGPLVTFQTY